MIRGTLLHTKAATFAIHFPDPSKADLPTPVGTGFFVSATGHFLTAAHVVTANGQPDGPLRSNLASAVLMKELHGGDALGTVADPRVCRQPQLFLRDATADVALLKFDRELNLEYKWLQDASEFPYLELSGRVLDEAEPVYAFGYPLSDGRLLQSGPGAFFGSLTHHPRVTSAIVASTYFSDSPVLQSGPPLTYVLDKALNYGNSGGPILAQSTGRVHALCSRFQPVFIPQLHLRDDKGNAPAIVIPSLYGYVTNLSHAYVRERLEQHNVAYSAS